MQTYTYLTAVDGSIWRMGVDSSGLLIVTAVSSIPGVPSAPTVNAIPALSGQNLLDLLNINLGGMANFGNQAQKLSYLNEGKDEIWGVLKSLDENYFVINSQALDATKTTYFGALLPSTREYTLPTDFRGMKFVEVTAPTGYEFVRFIRRSMTHPDFRDARRSSTAGGSSSGTSIGNYYYDVVGKATMMLAQYPEIGFTLTLWYVRALPDITLNASVDEIVFPFTKKIVDYAVMKIRLRDDATAFSEWREVWRQDLINVAQNAGRDEADPQFVQDWLG